MIKTKSCLTLKIHLTRIHKYFKLMVYYGSERKMIMFKKLTSLLFEEDDEMEEEELEEVIPAAPVRKKPKQVMPEPPIAKPAAPAMSRIDVEPVAPAMPKAPVKEPVFNAQPTVPHASPKPIAKEPVIPQEKAKPLGITVDEVVPAAPKPKAKPARAKVAPKPKAKKEPAKKTGVYEFKPVISPMFGVDEKDLDEQAHIKLTHSEKEESETSEIISPIYGQTLEPTYAKPVEEEKVEVEDVMPEIPVKETFKESTPVKEEDDIPAFSLDQILNGDRFDLDDEEEADLDQSMDEMIDETVVFDSPVFTTEESVAKEKEQKK